MAEVKTTTDTKVDAKPEADRKVQQISTIRFKPAEQISLTFIATAHENTFPEDLLDPAYFAHVASDLRPYYKIEARADDGTWFAEFLVLEVGRNWVRTYMLAKHMLTTSDVAMTQAAALSPYEVKWRGPHCKWSVIRKADKSVVHEGEESQPGADKWMLERLKAER
jgi:hypothetical protein